MKQNQKKGALKVLGQEGNVELAFLFGSEGRGSARKESDVDIAILLKRLPMPEKRLALRLGFSEKLNKIFGKEVDVVILNTAGSILKYQVTRHGKVLFERRKGLAKKFRINALKEYFDFLPTFNFHYERLRRQAHG